MKYMNSDVNVEDVQSIAFDVLKEFDRVCRINSISYQLFAGTLLGAVRHNGFIPWDDDIDVCMSREQYEKFIDCCPKCLNAGFTLQANNKEHKYFYQYAKLRKEGTVFRDNVTAEDDDLCGIYVDIFPMDNVKPNTASEKIRDKTLYFLYTLTQLQEKGFARIPSRNMFIHIAKHGVHYLSLLIPKQVLVRAVKRLLISMNTDECKYVNHLSNGFTKKRFARFLREKESISDSISHEFCGQQFPIPKDYDTVLHKCYGEYMQLPPENERYPHHNIVELVIRKEE